MKHTIAWSMNGTVEFDSDETDIDAIAEDFNQTTSEGFDFMRHGDVDGLEVDEVDDQHLHKWSYYVNGDDRCFRCLARRPHEHDWHTYGKRQQCWSCRDERPTP